MTNETMKKEMKTSTISLKHNLFWSGVDSLIQIQKKNSNLRVLKERTLKADAGISPTDLKVCQTDH